MPLHCVCDCNEIAVSFAREACVCWASEVAGKGKAKQECQGNHKKSSHVGQVRNRFPAKIGEHRRALSHTRSRCLSAVLLCSRRLRGAVEGSADLRTAQSRMDLTSRSGLGTMVRDGCQGGLEKRQREVAASGGLEKRQREVAPNQNKDT